MVNRVSAVLLLLGSCGCSDDGAAGKEGPGEADAGGAPGKDSAAPDGKADASPYPYSAPAARGPFAVGVTSIDFTDDSRDERFNPTPTVGERRLLVTAVWYPAAESARGEEGSDGTGATDAQVATSGPFPLIVFSHGNTGLNIQSSPLTSHLASHGYVVVSPNHRFNTLADYNAESFSPEGLAQRVGDASYLVDAMTELDAGDPSGRFTGAVDLERIGITGHSYGGVTTLGALAADDRFDVGAPITAGGTNRVGGFDAFARGITEPTLHFLATEDQTLGISGNAGVETMYELAEGPKAILRIRDAGHFSPTVICDIAAASYADDGCGQGTRLADPTQTFDFIPPARVFDVVNYYETALFGLYLKQVTRYADDLAAEPFPRDVEIERSGLP